MKEEKHENIDLDDLEDINDIESYLNNKKEKKYKSMFMKTFWWILIIYICICVVMIMLLMDNDLNSKECGYIAIIFIMSSALFISVSMLIFKIFQRFRKLSANFNEISSTNNMHVPEDGDDEIAMLGHQINDMVDHIEQLNKENVKKQLLMKNVEIKSLQNQINAHFMYNVLESIKMMAEIKGDYEISDAITSLGQMFRYSMKWTSGLVTLREELEYVQTYLNLLNLRFDYEIYLSLNIPEQYMDIEIPKMTLQPIVENSVYHGIEDMAEDTSIYIKVYDIVEKNILAIEVSDAGKGMDEEKLKEIKHEKARIALIGTGSRGQYHIHNLKEIPHAQIVAVCDNYAPNLQQALELCPDAKSYTDYRKLLESKDIDGVIISTPLNWHAPIVLDALAAGKHVFCEKAMARTLDECKAIYDTYNQSEKVLYFCMQRMYDEKYIKGMQMIHSGLIGDVVGMRCHWFRNADWRRPVPSPELERKINWRLYKDSSGGLMTELACHQLEVCNWAAKRMPVSIMGMGDIVYWKDGREVYDSVNVTYRYSDGTKIAYESLISNKFNGMEDQILGHKGTMEMAKGIYYLEEDHSTSGIRQLIDQVKDKVFAAIPTAGPSWRPETKMEYTPHFIIDGDIHVNSGLSMIGADKDGSDIILSSFCQSCITGEKAQNVVEEAYCSTVLCLLGNQAMDEQRHILFPDEYKIPYMKF